MSNVSSAFANNTKSEAIEAPASPRFKTKAEWARAKGDACIARAAAMRFESSGGRYGRACRKYEGIDMLHSEARRFHAMAERYERQGK